MSRFAYEPYARFTEWQDLSASSAWSEFLSALDLARSNAAPEDLSGAVEVALRSAALESGAIEGLYATSRGVTRMVALQGAMWEAELDKLGPDVRGHFEAQLAALDLVLDAATKRTPMSEAWLRALHAQVCANQKTYRVLTDHGWQERPLEHGANKTDPNNVTLADGTTHWYCPVNEIAPEMHRLQEGMRSDDFEAAHPVIQAAFAHHALTAVHPFSDGNGRAARALASVFLYRGAGVPLIVFSDQQERYWDALAAADDGAREPFVRFIDDSALDAMALVTNRLREAKGTLEESATALKQAFRSHGGLSPGEVAAVGKRLTDYLRGELSQLVRDPLPLTDFAVEVGVRQGRQQCDFNAPYHTLPDGGAFVVAVQSRDPIATAKVQATPFVGLADDTANPYAFIVIDANRPGNAPLKLRIGGLHPSITKASAELIEGWARTTAKQLIDELTRAIGGDLKHQGYA